MNVNEVNLDLYKEVRELFMDFGQEAALKILKDRLGIDAKPVKYAVPDGAAYAWMLNYDQIESPKTHPLVMQCRSLIVDTFGEVVSSKFTRFFNIGEAPAIVGQIDLTDSTVFDKEDGSLIGIWYDYNTDRWQVSTRSQAIGDMPFELQDGSQTTWRDMIVRTLLGRDYFVMTGADNHVFDEYMTIVHDAHFGQRSERNVTYVFEWVSPLNRIVTPYSKDAMILTGVMVNNRVNHKVIDMEPGSVKHIAFTFGEWFENVHSVRFFDSAGMNIEELQFRVGALTDLKEGFVIRCNKTGIRAKLKSSTYVTAHRLRGEFSVPRDKDLLELIRTGEVDEFVAYFPEWKERIDVITRLWNAYQDFLDVIYSDALSEIEAQKDYALSVQGLVKDGTIGHMAQGLLFGKRQGKRIAEQVKSLSTNKAFDLYQEIVKLSKQ